MESVFTPRATSLTFTAEHWETISDALRLLADHHESQEAFTAAESCLDLNVLVTLERIAMRHPEPKQATRRRGQVGQLDAASIRLQSVTFPSWSEQETRASMLLGWLDAARDLADSHKISLPPVFLDQLLRDVSDVIDEATH